MFVKLLGILMVVIGIVGYFAFKKQEAKFSWKSKNGLSVLFFLICGVFLFVTSTPSVDKIDYTAVAAPKNAPWEVEMTKEEAKEKNKTSKELDKELLKTLKLKNADKKRFVNGSNDIAMIRTIISELTRLGVGMSDESGQSYDISKKDAKIMLKYVKSVKKPLESSANYLNDNFDDVTFANYAIDITEGRKGLEKALKLAVKGGSYDEIDEIIVDEYLHYVTDAYNYYFDGSAYAEFTGLFISE